MKTNNVEKWKLTNKMFAWNNMVVRCACTYHLSKMNERKTKQNGNFEPREKSLSKQMVAFKNNIFFSLFSIKKYMYTFIKEKKKIHQTQTIVNKL